MNRIIIDDTNLVLFDQLQPSKVYMGVKWLISTVTICFFLPFILFLLSVVAVLVRFGCATDGGSIIFRQERVGLNGKRFILYKFRTMLNKENYNHQFTQMDDQRISRLGHLLRKYRLDELPQFWNILKGDMALIGPRPEQTVLVEQFNQTIKGYPYRHKVRPGLTGWAQVNQGYAATSEETVEKLTYDLYYLKHFGPKIDLLIIWKTILVILTGFGAR